MKLPLTGKTHLDVLKERQKYLLKHLTGYEWQARRFFKQIGEPVWMQVIVGFYIVDFLGRERPFILELDDPRHDENTEYDDKRSNFLESFGFQVYRLSNEDVSALSLTRIIRQVDRVGEREIKGMLAEVNHSPEVALWHNKTV